MATPTRNGNAGWGAAELGFVLGVVAASSQPGLQAIAFPAAELQRYRSPAVASGYFHARIPAVVLAGPVLLAVAECAQCQPGCGQYVGWSADLCAKRSADGGRSWHNFSVVVPDGSQPDLVFDRVKGQVILNFNLHRTGDWPHGGKNMQVVSTDFGASWGIPTELPAALGLQAAECGPGIGLQLSRGPHAGRVLFSGWRDQRAGAALGEAVWFSDDHGRSFQAAPSFPGGGAEAQLAESRNGTVVIMFRVNQGGAQASRGRQLAYSVDGGASFSEPMFNSDLRSTPCQGSILGSRENGRVYYSSPSDLVERKLGLVRSSPDGLDWSNHTAFPLTKGEQGFGYSSLTELPQPGVLGVLWEKQVVGTHQPTDLAFSFVPLSLETA